MGRIIAITGGIGSGKSVVSSILRVMGYSVCDTDSFAKSIMDNSDSIKIGLRELFGADILNADNSINRVLLGSIVFNDEKALKSLNALVHPIVTEQIISWANSSSADLVFIETAILNASGLRKYVEQEWNVSAPTELKVERVMKRNNLTSAEVMLRIDAQNSELTDSLENDAKIIMNDNNIALIPQINILLQEFKRT
ncbi:MAG: dephospho-CoA kinase [Bacteroidales bacterium]